MKKIGCTRCPYAGHIELKECVDAYTEVSKYCGLYNHNELGKDNNTKELINEQNQTEDL